MSAGRALLDAAMSERQLQQAVVANLRARGWVVFWTWDSRHSPCGEPDIRACRPPRYLLAELKTERGRLTEAQKRAAELLGQCAGVEYYEVRPATLDAFLAAIA